MSYQLTYPRQIVFGWGAWRTLGDYVDRNRPFALVTGGSQQRNGVVDEAVGLLGQPAVLHVGVPTEPTVDDVDALVAKLRATSVEAIIAIGGGSVIDVAKAAAVIAPREGSTVEYFAGDRKVTTAGIPLIALPTTAGTGAEITRNSVLTDPATLIKQSIRHDVMVARTAIVDPELTVSLPQSVTAASGLDALTQAIESYLSNKATQVSLALARQAVQLIWPSLPVACRQPDNREARTAMAEGSMLTAMAFAHSGLGAVHGLAHPLGAILHEAHGKVCAILLPPVLRTNATVSGQRLQELAHAVGLDDAPALVAAVETLVSELGIPSGFSGLQRDHYPYILANCRSGSMRCNPRELSDTELSALLDSVAG